MGIRGLKKLVEENAPSAIGSCGSDSYKGCKIAIDTNIFLYDWMRGIIWSNGGPLKCERTNKTTSHLYHLFGRASDRVSQGITPIFILDGRPPVEKLNTIVKRRAEVERALIEIEKMKTLTNLEDEEQMKMLNDEEELMNMLADIGEADAMLLNDENAGEGGPKKTALTPSDKKYRSDLCKSLRITKEQYLECKELLYMMGVPVDQAPDGSEAEAVCSALCRENKAQAVCSRDTDVLPFGAENFVFGLTPYDAKKKELEFNLSKILGALELTMPQFIDLCILLGCDYCDRVEGLDGLTKEGRSTALRLVREHKSIEQIISTKSCVIPSNWNYEAARKLFNDLPVLSEDLAKRQYTVRNANSKALRRFLLPRGFSVATIDKNVKNLDGLAMEMKRLQ